MRLIGPNCAGLISPGHGFMGIMPTHIYVQGRIGIVGRSGTLGYEAASQMKALGIGVSTSVGIGGDPINGSSFRDILELFETDPETDAVMMIGEIGGPQEAEAAAFVREHMTKPVDRLRRRALGAQGPQDGPCRRDHLGLRRERAGEGRDPRKLRHPRRPEPVGHGRDRRPRRRPAAGRLTTRAPRAASGQQPGQRAGAGGLPPARPDVLDVSDRLRRKSH